MKKILALLTAIGLMVAVATPANAWWRGGYGGYYGGYGYGGYGAAMGVMAGAALLGGIVGGLASQPYYGGYYGGYGGYGYYPAYRGYYPAPAYANPYYYGW